MENGKTLAELDVKAGDVVSWRNEKEYIIGGIRDNGLYYRKDSEHWASLSTDAEWSIVSRSSPPTATKPTPPRKMHPDDFMLAVSEFATDNGFGVTKIEFNGLKIGPVICRHSYSV